MLFFVGLMFKASPLLVIGELCWGILMNVPSRLISVIGVKYIIDVMTSGERVYRIFWAVGIIAAVIVFSRVISWLFREFFWNVEKEKCYFSQKVLTNRKHFDTIGVINTPDERMERDEKEYSLYHAGACPVPLPGAGFLQKRSGAGSHPDPEHGYDPARREKRRHS